MPHSFLTDVQPYGPGSIIFLKSPALQVGLSTLGATVHSVRVNPHFQPASVLAAKRINVHDHPLEEAKVHQAAAAEDTNTWTEVNMQYNKYEEALADCGAYLGATVGRYAGRIGNGTFSLNGKVYHTPKNQNGENTIHGGGNALDKKQWQYKVLNSTTHPHPHAHHPVASKKQKKQPPPSSKHNEGEEDDDDSSDEEEAIDRRHYLRASFHYLSPHNENGFPGELHCTVTYTIYQKQPHALCMDFTAVLTPKSPANATIVNMFNHAYWNLNGFPARPPTAYQGSSSGSKEEEKPWPQAEPIHNHHLRLPTADTVAETDGAAIPSGKMVSVAGSPLDFRGAGHLLGDGIDDQKALCRDPSGYDHPFFMSDYRMPSHLHSRHQGKKMSLNAVMRSPTTGIEMSVFSTFPCLWVYTANNLKADAKGTPGERFARYRACCLEPQHLPDAINHTKTFPRTSFIVTKKSPYVERIVNVFHVKPHAPAAAAAAQQQKDTKEGQKEAARATSLLPKYLSKL